MTLHDPQNDARSFLVDSTNAQLFHIPQPQKGLNSLFK